jgi:protein subunit release factor A
MKLTLELRPGEGGQDAKLLAVELGKMYLKAAEKQGVTASISHSLG